MVIPMNKQMCLVCNESKIKKYQFFFSQYLPKIIGRTAICTECGHIQVWPIYTDEKIQKINERYHSGKFLSDVDSSQNNQSKLNKLRDDLKNQNLEGKKILDIGAGEAWSKKFFDEHHMQYYAIEPIDKLQENIKNLGGTVIGPSIFNELTEYNESFDLVLLRHVIEHTNIPQTMLSNIYKLLKKDALLYIALPNAAAKKFKKPIRTSFYRPSHISYFHPEGIQYLLRQCSFEVKEINLHKEIAIIAKKSSRPNSQLVHPKNFKEQRDRMSSAARKSLLSDTKGFIKLILRKLLPI